VLEITTVVVVFDLAGEAIFGYELLIYERARIQQGAGLLIIVVC
jgi:hypothetical protein